MAETAAPGSAPSPAQQAAENVTDKRFANPAQQPGQQTPAEGSTQGNPAKDAAAEAMRKFKVKVDNQEVEVDEAELLKGYTHGRAAAKRFQEGSKAKDQALAFVKMMKDKGTLFDAIKKLGHDPRQLAEEYLAAQIQDDLMDPKDKELKTYKQKVDAYEAEKAKQEETTKQQEHERLKTKYAKEYSEQFVDALKKSGLPQTKPMVAEMAKYIKRAADIGYQLSADDAAKLVREDETTRIQGIVGESEAEILANLLGENTLQKLRAYDTQRVKNPNAQLNTPKDQADEIKRRRDSGARMTPQEWRAFNRK